MLERSNSTHCRIAFLTVWLTIVVACSVGFAGANNVRRGLNDFGEDVQTTVNSIIQITDQIGALGVQASHLNVSTSQIAQSVVELTDATHKIADQLQDGRTLLAQYIDKFVAVIDTGFAMPIVALGLSVIAYLLKFKPENYSIFIYIITTLTSVFVWLSFGFSMPFAVLARAACQELDNAGGVNKIYGSCLDAVSAKAPIDAIQTPLQAVLTELKNDAQTYLNVYINDTLPAQNETIPATVQSWSYYCNDQIQDIRNSAAYNALPSNGGVKAKLDAELAGIGILLQMLALVSQLANCSYLTDLYRALSENVCGRMIDGFFQMAHPDWIIGTLLVPGTAILIAVFRAEQPGDKDYNTGPATGVTSAYNATGTGGGGTSSTPQNNLFPGAGAGGGQASPPGMQMGAMGGAPQYAQGQPQYAPQQPPPPVLAPAEPLKEGLMTGAFGAQSQFTHQPQQHHPQASAPYAPAPGQPGMMGGAFAFASQQQQPPPHQQQQQQQQLQHPEKHYPMQNQPMQPIAPQYGTTIDQTAPAPQYGIIDPNAIGGGGAAPPGGMLSYHNPMDTYATQPLQQPIPSYVPSPAHAADPNTTSPPPPSS